MQGQGIDAPLTSRGFKQAVGVGRSFHRSFKGQRGRKWLVYSSNMRRASQSLSGFLQGFSMADAEDDGGDQLLALESFPRKETVSSFASESCGPQSSGKSDAIQRDVYPTSSFFSPAQLVAPLREKAQGSREGKRNDMTLKQAEAADEASGIDWRSLKKETDEEVADRLSSFLDETFRKIHEEESSAATNVLMVTHGGVIRVLLRDVLKVGGGAGEPKIQVWNSSITQVDVSSRCEAAHEGESAKISYKPELVGVIGNTSFIPPSLVTKRSDW